MPLPPSALHAFRDEVEKIAISRGRMCIPQDRKGRRPIRVSKLLEKEKAGTLYKAGQLGVSAEYQSSNEPKGKGAKYKRSEDEVPSREDGRENTLTIMSPSSQVNDIAATTSTTGGLG